MRFHVASLLVRVNAIGAPPLWESLASRTLPDKNLFNFKFDLDQDLSNEGMGIDFV